MDKKQNAEERTTYIKDFKKKFPNCIFDEVDICSKFCVNQLYKNSGLRSCEATGTLSDCIECWHEYVK